MKTFKETVFSVRQIRDYGSHPLIANFSSEEEARKLLPLIDGYGGDLNRETIELTVYDSFEEYMADKSEELKKSALGKLTKEERIALGI
jgi:hypothetical protein